MRRRMPHSIQNVLCLLGCIILLSLGTSFAQFAQPTSDELLYSQIRNQAEAGSNDLQASVIIVAGDSVFIDAGKVAGVEKSNYRGGQLMRRTNTGEELIANFQVIEVGGEVSQVAVATVFGQEVQMGDRAVFGEYSAQAGLPNGTGTLQASSRKDSLNGLFADTDPNAGRAIGLANNVVPNSQTNVASRAYNPNEMQVTKSSVIPTGTAAELLAGLVSGAAAKSEATGAPLYCLDPRFAQREACLNAPVPLMANSTVAPVNMQSNVVVSDNSAGTVYGAAASLPANVPGYCSSPTYMSRPECAATSATPQQPVQTQTYQQVSVSQPAYAAQPAQAAQAVQAAALPGYCIDSRFASRSECMTGASSTGISTSMATASAAPSYCSTPGNESRPECLSANTVNNNVINERGYGYQTNSHISTATAATGNVAAGTALAIDPYTGKPYTTSYQGYNGDTATPLVHTAAQAQTAQNHNSTIGLGNSVAGTSVTTVTIPASTTQTHVGPATIANQTLAATVSAPAASSYTTAQTYYDSDWGDNWDPTYVNTTPNATGIIPAGSPAPYYLRIARVKNNLGFPNEAIEIIEMGLAQYPNEATLQSELTMIYRMLSDGGTPTDWCAPEEIGIAPEPIATVDDCPEEDVYDDHTHDDYHDESVDHSHDDDYGHDDQHDDEHDDYGSNDENQSYANDYRENIQVSTRYNAPLNNNAPLSNNENQSYAAQQNLNRAASANTNQSYAAQQTLDADVNQSYAAQNKPTFTSPLGMANGLGDDVYNAEKGGIVRPAWNTNK